MGGVFGRRRKAAGTRKADGAAVTPGPPARPGRDPRWAWALVVTGTLLLLSSTATLVGGRLLVSRYLGAVHQTSLLGAAAAPRPVSAPLPHARLDGPLNLLLMGIDERTDDPDGGARSDSIIIVHVPASHDRAYLISIPRDSRVQIPAYPPTGYPGGTEKINAAFAYGFGFTGNGSRSDGFQLLALTIKQLTGISFDAGAIVNFAGLRSVVDAVGGVDLCVDEETTSIHVGRDAAGKPAVPYRQPPPDQHLVPVPGVRPQVYHAGCQHFTGWQALDYVRQRELLPDGDYGRQRHQQQLIAALVKKISRTGLVTDPLAADRTMRALGSAVTFDGNGLSLPDWIMMLKGIDPDAITMVKTNGGRFNTEVIGGQDFEILTDASRDLFQAAHDDTLDTFIAAHPDWVTSNTTQ